MTNSPDINHKMNHLIADRTNQEAEEQIIEANRILTEMQSIDSLSAYVQVRQRIQNDFNKYRLWEIFKKVAAVLFIPLLVTTAWFFHRQIDHDPGKQYSIQKITSPPGIRSQVILPDGSNVWLNASSTIRFSVPFNNETRNVDLLGEAFFEVKKNPENPFIVHSGNVKVKVLGTRFNCKAFDEDSTIEVTLEEGKIALNIQSKTETNEVEMKPGDHAIVSKGRDVATIKSENICKYVAWHKGKLVFDNTPMTEVAQMISRWYGVNVIVKDPEIINYRFTTTFENEPLFEVIELLKLSSPILIKYVPATIGKDNQKLTCSKVFISKNHKSK